MIIPRDNRPVDGLMTIGDFSRAVRMSAKALRFYHRSGVLAPAHVDEQSGYRLYAAEQIADAQIVRTLRELDVPVESIRDVLAAPSIEVRAKLMSEHLDRMEAKLSATRVAVANLRSILEPSRPPIEIVHRSVPETRVVAIREDIPLEKLGGWFRRATSILQRIAENNDPSSTGAYGGIWPNGLFSDEYGTATVYLPVGPGFDDRTIGDDATVLDLPAVELAVATHDGPDATVPRVYAALGEYVARHELAVDAPVRETYVTGLPGVDRTVVMEIGWPIFRVSR